MILKDLHVHSTFSDGKNTPEEIVQFAIQKGLKTIGFSDHSYTSFKDTYCLGKDINAYINEISALKEKYKNEIEILIGIEQDYFSNSADCRLDYIIGSVHFFKFGEEFIPVDLHKNELIEASKKYFNGDILALAEKYYQMVENVVEKTNADIIGHFDLITKYNEDGTLFDENSERYVSAYKKAVDKLIETGKLFEINTGVICRGYRTTPYPSKQIYYYIKSKGGKFILSSDSHRASTLCSDFEKYEILL